MEKGPWAAWAAVAAAAAAAWAWADEDEDEDVAWAIELPMAAPMWAFAMCALALPAWALWAFGPADLDA